MQHNLGGMLDTGDSNLDFVRANLSEPFFDFLDNQGQPVTCFVAIVVCGCAGNLKLNRKFDGESEDEAEKTDRTQHNICSPYSAPDKIFL